MVDKILELKKGNNRVGSIEIKNQSENSADLFFYGDIVSESWISEWYEDDMCPKDVEKFLAQLENISHIEVHINSGGGSCNGGLAIYNLLKRYNADITVYIDGLAASIASVIAMVGDKIIMPENSLLMIHKPSIYSSGNADDLRKDADILDTYQKSILSVYMTKVKEGITEDQINEMINKETWFTAEEAKEYFDIEIEESKNIAACTSNYFNKYKNMPLSIKNKNNREKLPVMDEATRLFIKRIKKL